jgi:hypothetical protein
LKAQIFHRPPLIGQAIPSLFLAEPGRIRK